MLQVPRRTLMTALLAVAALTLVGAMVGTFLAFMPISIGGGSPGASVETAPPVESTDTAAPPAAAMDSRSVAVNGVSLTLTDIRRSADPKGIEVIMELSNQSSGALAFPFFPERDISLYDDRGSNYNFRWAEYKGEVRVEAGHKARLVRAFFAGPDKDVKPERLTLGISNLPQIGKASWEINWPASSANPTQIVASTPAPKSDDGQSTTDGIGSMVTQNKVSLTLADAELNSQLGGLMVTMSILNNTAGELSFLFSPERQLAVVDNRGNKFSLRWAEYDGATKVARGQQVRLVRAFFDGPVADPLTTMLTISVAGIPEFGGASWKVPVDR